MLLTKVQDYLKQATAEFEARGLSAEEARRAAQLEFGSPTMIGTGTLVWMGTPLWDDHV